VDQRGNLHSLASSAESVAEIRRRRSTAWNLGTFVRLNPTAVAGGIIGLLIVFLALTAPLIAPYDPLKADFRLMAKPPDTHNYFGTDQIGRDTLTE
jgi:ABC-type dipeptide/oligopeptide/nickel transport system permease subunit